MRVFNSRGEVRLRAHVNGAVQPGVVAARLNAARFTPDGNSINVLTSETLTDIGGGATFYSCLVEVEPIAAPIDPLEGTNTQIRKYRVSQSGTYPDTWE